MTKTATKWASGINVVLGLVILAAPFVLESEVAAAWGAVTWNNVIVGTLIALLAAYHYTRGESSGAAAASGVVALLGLWTLVTPWVYSLGDTMFWVNALAGLAVTVLAGFSGYASGRMYGLRRRARV